MIFNDFSDSDCAGSNLTATASDSFESSLASSLSEMNLDFKPSQAQMTPDLIQLERYTWNYRGEGGANLVISLEVTFPF